MTFDDAITETLSNNPTVNKIGIAGFTGFARTNESTKYTNTVPTDFLEDGTSASDDIINDAIAVTINGVVGDMMVADQQFPEIIPQSVLGLGEITALLPGKTQQQFQRIAQINSQVREGVLLLQRAERIGQRLYDFVSGNFNTAKSEQQLFVDTMEAFYYSALPMEISVSFKNYKNMVIQDLVISRDSQDGSLRFSVVFLQQRYTSLLYTEVSKAASAPKKPSGATSDKAANPTNEGGQNPETNDEPETESALYGIFG